MKRMLMPFLAAAVSVVFQGCSPASHDGRATQRAPQRADPAQSGVTSSAQRDRRPARLENCLTAVGADRTQCVAKEK